MISSMLSQQYDVFVDWCLIDSILLEMGYITGLNEGNKRRIKNKTKEEQQQSIHT